MKQSQKDICKYLNLSEDTIEKSMENFAKNATQEDMVKMQNFQIKLQYLVPQNPRPARRTLHHTACAHKNPCHVHTVASHLSHFSRFSPGRHWPTAIDGATFSWELYCDNSWLWYLILFFGAPFHLYPKENPLSLNKMLTYKAIKNQWSSEFRYS